MRKLVRAVVTAGTALAVAMTAACGSDSGPAKPAYPPEPAIDLSKLDTGNLATQPKLYGKAVNLDQARALEAERLANYIPLPVEVDPAVKYAGQPMAAAIRPFIDFGSGAMKQRIDADPGAMNAAAKGFVSGFVTTGKSDEADELSYELENIVLIFSDDASAGAAAQALGQTDLTADHPKQRVSIDKYPAAFAYTDDTVPGLIRSWYATGKFVIFTRVYDNVMGALKTQDQAKLAAHVQRSLDVIPPALAKFPATPADKMADLPIDLDGVLGRTLPTILDDTSQAGIPGVYELHGGLQLIQGDDDTTSLTEAGVDRVAWKGGYVFRARDYQSAEKLIDERAETSRTFKAIDPPPNLPNAVCRQYVGPAFAAISYYCWVAHDRYVAELSANQLLDVQQRIAAQYAMLVNAH